MPFSFSSFRASSSRECASRARRAFTLTEMLVVIGIILLLSAILFPAFKSAQERGAQTTCTANMQQIYLAVRLYKDDEREYPASLAALMPDTNFLNNTQNDTDAITNDEGTGYFRKPTETLFCPNGDTEAPADEAQPGRDVRSSYGDLSSDITRKATHETFTGVAAYGPVSRAQIKDANNLPDWGRSAWNYWGYDDEGVAYRSADEVMTLLSGLSAADAKKLLRNPKQELSPDYEMPSNLQNANFYYNPRGAVRLTGATDFEEDPREANPLLYSLSNRFAPDSTIITHCVFHRLPTGANLIGPNPTALYGNTNGKGARDIVLRLDGTAKSYDISTWKTPGGGRGSFWQFNDF